MLKNKIGVRLLSLFFLFCLTGCVEKEEETYLYVNPEDIPSPVILVRNGEFGLLKKLFKNHPEVINREAERCLMAAIDTQQKDLVKFLLHTGIGVNDAGLYYASPLHYAVEKGNKEMMAYLVKQGAQVSIEEGFESLVGLAIKIKTGILFFF
ncbi:MAG: ankyrin repeat domain-containing protein [Tannerellaceae bacterium]|nr:ankyrin repeat domain-containing protein [Tannerellaceae bacterium]